MYCKLCLTYFRFYEITIALIKTRHSFYVSVCEHVVIEDRDDSSFAQYYSNDVTKQS